MSLDNLSISQLIEKISQITKSSNKNDFVKQYNEIHSNINKIEDILNKPNEIDINTDILTLSQMLEQYDTILENNTFTTEQYKHVCDIIKLLDDKLKNLTMNVNEIQ
jgi:phenylalanyl-tRNA synthetase alpha subunit